MVQRVTKGLANYINKTYNNPSVIISYDSRKNSNVFAMTAAEVLSQNGIKVYICLLYTSTVDYKKMKL